MKLKEEEILQTNIVKYYNMVLKHKIQTETLLYSNRNENNKGGIRGIISGSIYKEMGRIAGIPDLTFLYNGKIAFIEVKTQKAYFTATGNISKSMGLSNDQILMHKKLRDIGHKVKIVYDIDSFKDFILNLFIDN